MNKNTNTKSSVPKMNLTEKPSSNSFGRGKISAHTIIMIIGIVFSSILFSCKPKKNKKELVIYNNNQIINRLTKNWLRTVPMIPWTTKFILARITKIN